MPLGGGEQTLRVTLDLTPSASRGDEPDHHDEPDSDPPILTEERRDFVEKVFRAHRNEQLPSLLLTFVPEWMLTDTLPPDGT